LIGSLNWELKPGKNTIADHLELTLHYPLSELHSMQARVFWYINLNRLQTTMAVL